MTTSLRADRKQQKVLRSLMDQQQAIEIGRRIRELRENSEETNGSIADYCNVRERTVAGWVAGAGISYKNAKRVAKPSHIDEIYDQQKGTCKTEARFNTPEYRNHNGSTNPEEYARYAAEHGFFKITSEEEMQAAVDGCLDGIQQLGDKAK